MKRREGIQEWEALFNESDEDFEIDELTRMLDEYSVQFPHDEVIQRTIDNCLVHVPQHPSYASRFVKKFKRTIHAMTIQTGYLARSFWMLSLLLFLYGYLATLHHTFNPYETILLLAPMPVVLGVLELMRGLDSGMCEIELACKMSLPEVIFARFVLIGLYNIVLNSAISLGLYFTSGIDLWRLVLLWLVPFTWVATGMLFLVTKFRGKVLSPIALCIWSGIAIRVLSIPGAVPFLLSLNAAILVGIVIVGTALLCLQCKSLYQRVSGGMFVEVAD